jgi:hypothetical protein
MPDMNNNSPDIQQPEEASSLGDAPSAGGMMTPQAPEGEIEEAKLSAYHACRLIDRAIAKFGRKSEYTDTLMRARAVLTSKFGEFEEDSQKYSDAEIKGMLMRLAGPGQPPKQQQPGGGGQQQPQQGQQPGEQ